MTASATLSEKEQIIEHLIAAFEMPIPQAVVAEERENNNNNGIAGDDGHRNNNSRSTAEAASENVKRVRQKMQQTNARTTH